MKRPRLCDFSRYRHGCDLPDPRVVVHPQVDTAIHHLDSSPHIHHATRLVFCNAAATVALVSILTGCGSSPSDPAPDFDSRTAEIRNAGVEPQETRQDFNACVSGGGNRSSRNDPSSAGQPALSSGAMDEHYDSPAFNIPEVIAKDLGSPDARTRYRVLDHWERNDNKAPLDPVIESMEDEDEAVRAKATAIAVV